METFYEANLLNSDEEYLNILRAGIMHPRVFLKRELSEKWPNAFNPFLFNLLQSNTDIQFITEEYSFAAYVVEYVIKANRGISNLQRQIIKIMDEHPDFEIVEIKRKMSIDMLNTVEMTRKKMDNARFYQLMRMANMASLLEAGCGKTFAIKLLMEISRIVIQIMMIIVMHL
ncbi:ATP-dependent DNA helicase [Trichonephila clavipes]|nr:ATP-dependent DNA helicase [Trichonephila clavipes]